MPAYALAPADLRALREALLRAGYTADGVLDLLGPVAHDALARLETVPARRRTTGGSPLETLVRLFLLQLAVPRAAAARALPLAAVLAAGIVQAEGDEVVAAIDVRPHSGDAGDDYYVASDLASGLDGRRRAPASDWVLGIGGASTTLAQLTVREPVGRALDLGTGSGVQALHLSSHAASVTATDVLPRALDLARLSAGLSEVELDLRLGGLWEPVAGERFDLVVSNPPFVIGGDGRFAYRDGGLVGDEIGRRLVAGAVDHLTEGGWCQLLANWVHRDDEDWRERVTSWLPAGVDAWVVQREVQDPAAYVALWLRDAGDDLAPDYVERYDAWLDAFDRAGVTGVGFGFVSLRRTESDRPRVRVQDWPHAVAQPLGAEVAASFARGDWLRDREDRALLAERLVVAPDVVQEATGEPGAEDPAHLVLRQGAGLRRAEQVDTATAALVGACDGTLPLGALIAAVAEVVGSGSTSAADLLPRVRGLVADGFLVPADLIGD